MASRSHQPLTSLVLLFLTTLLLQPLSSRTFFSFPPGPTAATGSAPGSDGASQPPDVWTPEMKNWLKEVSKVGKISTKDREWDKLIEEKTQAQVQAGMQPRTIAPIPLSRGNFSVEYAMMGYRTFVPRLFNWCTKTLGMTYGNIMPSLGFCSDENQGYPTIIVTKHFGTYPFNHGYIGGIMALDRHGPHAAHGEDLVIIHAPHVGYDPLTQKFGQYRRRQVKDPVKQLSSCCGKIAGVLKPYKDEYAQMLGRIWFKIDDDGRILVSLTNTIVEKDASSHGIFMNKEKMLRDPSRPLTRQSTSSIFEASAEFSASLKAALREGRGSLPPPSEETAPWQKLSSHPVLKKSLAPEFFYFKSRPLEGERNRLERELLPVMPQVLTTAWDPELSAAMICTQNEFDRTVHSIRQEKAYAGRNLLLISGLNIDMSPPEDLKEPFPSTYFLPWASYYQTTSGVKKILEQEDTVRMLYDHSIENDDAIDMEVSINQLYSRSKFRVAFWDTNQSKIKNSKIL